MSILDLIALALSACSVLMLFVLVARRGYLKRRELRRQSVEDGLKRVALELLDAGVPPPPDLTVHQKEALADLLGRYVRAIRGETHGRVVEYFAQEGMIERELGVLTEANRPWRRATAAFRLGDIGNDSAIPALVGALKDSDAEVRIAAARSLGRLRAAEAGPSLVAAAAERRVPRALIGWSLLQIGVSTLPELRSLLRSPEARARASAVQMIGLLGGPSDAGEIEDRLRDSSALVRTQAAYALGRIGGRRNLEGLLATLDDRIPAVREAVATALGQLRDGSALEALAGHATGDQFEVARASAQALASINVDVAAEQVDATGSPHLAEAVDLVRVL